MEVFALAGYQDVSELATLYNARSAGRRNIGLDLMSDGAFFIASLDGSEAIAMQRRVDVWRVGIKTLADHQNTFAMRSAAGFEKSNVSAQSDISRHLFPNELKGVGRSPNILATARDRKRACARIVLDTAGVKYRTYIRVVIEQRNVLGRSAAGGNEATSQNNSDHLKNSWNAAAAA